MRVISDIPEVKSRLALRARLPLNHGYRQGDARMRVILAASHGHRIPHSDSDFSFDVPIDIDMHEEETPTFSMSKINDDEAQLHGYANASDMRKSLGFRKGEEGTIFSYRLLSPPIPENDLAFAGERARVTHAAYEAFRGAKGDKIIFNSRTGAVRESREPSIKRARNHLKTLPHYAALIAEASITPREHQDKLELAPFAPPPMYTRRSNETEQPRVVPSEISALRMSTLPEHNATECDAKAPVSNLSKTGSAGKPARPAPVSYATEYGKRGQYSTQVQRPEKQGPSILSPEELRAVKASKQAKRQWRDRVARAAFGVGEDIAPEPAAFKKSRPIMNPLKPRIPLEPQNSSHLNDESAVQPSSKPIRQFASLAEARRHRMAVEVHYPTPESYLDGKTYIRAVTEEKGKGFTTNKTTPTSGSKDDKRQR